MVLDELIHHVSKFWYKLHWFIWVGINLAFLAGYILSKRLPDSGIETTYGLNDAVLYMSIGMLVYLTTIYWLVAKASRALATFIGSLLIVLQFMNVFNETNQSSSSLIYVVAWLFISLLVGMHGLVILLGAMLVTFIYLMLEIEFDFSNLEPISLLLILGSVLVVIIGYFFWRNRFITESSERVNQLSGMLKSNKQQSEILMQSIADGIIVIDTKGKITLINEAASKLTAWPAKEAVGFDAKTVLKLVKDVKAGKPLSDDEHPFNQVIRNHKAVSDTLQLFNKENKGRFISLVISPVILPSSKDLVGAVAVFRDVSKEKEQEKQRADFISTASHEMRTPVAAIEGYLALALNDKVSKIDDKAREYLNKAHSSTQHLGQLFQDLLTSAKAEDGRLTSHPKVVEMSEFTTQIAEDLKFVAEKKGLGMELVINAKSGGGEVIDTSSSLKTI
ncbi:MAG TPA: histidine kinase dimerization/phospho-acceptor domain-containing protein, partial [Patescibacteria group bacterium]|nr:histidine kinase dimerization/phospho-acceptor domain-containing protein [Patescibacteria group bacterium]